MSNLRVHALSIGGTISMVPTQSGLVPSLGASDLLSGDLSTIATVTAESLEPLPGASLTSETIADIVQRAHTAVDAGAVGVIVTQGTDTLEETAFLADLMWDRPQPLVFTGAMRPAQASGSDGPANLYAAVRVAADSDASNRGVVVVISDQVYSAITVSKTHASRPAAFSASDGGPLGSIVESQVRWWSSPRRPAVAPFATAHSPSGVLTVVAQLNSAADILGFARESDSVSAVVVAAMGVGHVPSWWVEPLSELCHSKPVTYATRTGSGAVFTSTYGFNGSERDLAQIGLMPAGPLTPHKARLLLAQCVGAAHDRTEAEDLYRNWISALSR